MRKFFAELLWRNLKIMFWLASLKTLTNCDNPSSNPLQTSYLTLTFLAQSHQKVLVECIRNQIVYPLLWLQNYIYFVSHSGIDKIQQLFLLLCRKRWTPVMETCARTTPLA
jgi:hypothetical protein